MTEVETSIHVRIWKSRKKLFIRFLTRDRCIHLVHLRSFPFLLYISFNFLKVFNLKSSFSFRRLLHKIFSLTIDAEEYTYYYKSDILNSQTISIAFMTIKIYNCYTQVKMYEDDLYSHMCDKNSRIHYSIIICTYHLKYCKQ